MRIISPLIEYLTVSKKMKQVGSYEGAYTKSVYLPFTSNATLGQQYYFQPDEVLDSQNNFITGIELVDSVTNATAPTVPSTDPLSATQATQGYLYICNLNREVLATLPLYTLIRRLNAGKPTYLYFDEPVVWQNCFIQFESLGTAITTAHSVWLKVTYSPIEK
ncbi:MAG: hypothetical protein EBV27_06380 [Actinobacteria bacterium]|nr:hypothetical protein [Actinomycetota bacterium]